MMKIVVMSILVILVLFLNNPSLVLAGDYGSGPGVSSHGSLSVNTIVQMAPVNPVSMQVQPVPLAISTLRPVQLTVLPTIVPVASPTAVTRSVFYQASPTVTTAVIRSTPTPVPLGQESTNDISQETPGLVVVAPHEIGQVRLIRPNEASPMLMARELPKAGGGRDYGWSAISFLVSVSLLIVVMVGAVTLARKLL